MSSNVSPRRSSRGSPRRAARSESTTGHEDKTTSPVPSPGSWNVDRGRSRVRRPSNPLSEDNLQRRGYHTLMSSFGKVFHVEKRWKLVREMGSGAYGVVISAADEISSETVAIKLVTRVFDKVQLAKRALREITLLRHFNHGNITGLIDVDAISPDFNEIYIFMEPMEADLHQIIKSGQTLTNEHVRYFIYQVLRGMKYVHSASVIHRDLKPGNLLVNADCELKICDFGLSRGFESRPDETASKLTEYVATRWYRAPEIMLAFRRYTTAIDVWSIGCILAELLMGKPLFKGKDYVDQLKKILDVLGTPDEHVIKKIGSEKAQAYVRMLPFRSRVPFTKLIPSADAQAIDLLGKMLSFDPDNRISVPEALKHPWLESYHDLDDEPDCPRPFVKWREIEALETLDQFREALWKEIEDYRREVRGGFDLSGMPIRRDRSGRSSSSALRRDSVVAESEPIPEPELLTQSASEEPLPPVAEEPAASGSDTLPEPTVTVSGEDDAENDERRDSVAIPRRRVESTDPVVSYARRSSIISRQGSVYNSPITAHQVPMFVEGLLNSEPGSLGGSSIAFPSQPGYVVPARSRTGSTTGGEVNRRLLRTLSTVSIHESAEGLAGGLGQIAPIGKFIVEEQATTGADAPASEMPRDFAPGEDAEEDENYGQVLQSTKDKDRKFHVP